ALPPPDQLAAFYRIWARKESYLKARGGGLSISLTATCVTFDPYPTPRMLDLRDLPAAERQYSSVDLAAVPGYAAALTVAGPADPAGGDPLGHHARIDVLDVQRLDAIGVVAAELQDVIARPGEVPDVRPLEDHLPIDEREEAIDLRPGLDERADVVVEAGP